MAHNSRQPFLFLDLETNGHRPLQRLGKVLLPWHEIIEMAAVVVDQITLEVLEEFVAKIKIEHPERCDPQSMKVNDYLRRAERGEWKGAISLRNAVRDLLDLSRRHGGQLNLIGQNFTFDWSFLYVALEQSDVSEKETLNAFHYKKWETASMALQEFYVPGAPFCPSDYSLRNEILANRLEIPPEPYPHQGLNGARQAYMVYRKLQEIKINRRQGLTS